MKYLKYKIRILTIGILIVFCTQPQHAQVQNTLLRLFQLEFNCKNSTTDTKAVPLGFLITIRCPEKNNQITWQLEDLNHDGKLDRVVQLRTDNSIIVLYQGSVWWNQNTHSAALKSSVMRLMGTIVSPIELGVVVVHEYTMPDNQAVSTVQAESEKLNVPDTRMLSPAQQPSINQIGSAVQSSRELNQQKNNQQSNVESKFADQVQTRSNDVIDHTNEKVNTLGAPVNLEIEQKPKVLNAVFVKELAYTMLVFIPIPEDQILRGVLQQAQGCYSLQKLEAVTTCSQHRLHYMLETNQYAFKN